MPASSRTIAERSRKFCGLDLQPSQEAAMQRSFSTWTSMLERCFAPRVASTKANYPGRGITVCERWFLFSNFLQDMGFRPIGKSLDRIDNDAGYEPGNCRWATAKEQSHNSRRPVWVDLNGERITSSEAAARCGISSATVSRRMAAGLSVSAPPNLKPGCKLTAEQVAEIRNLIRQRVPDTTIGRRYGVSHSSIRNVRTGRTWGAAA